MRNDLRRDGGFTIVELLIVIVVISILATISVAAYNGVTTRSRDSARKQDMGKIMELLKLRNVSNTTTWVRSGANCNEEHGGFFTQSGISATGSDYGAKSAAQCLTEGSNTTTRFRDPSGADSCAPYTNCASYMFDSCQVGSEWHTYIYMKLETQSAATIDGTCSDGDNFDTLFGMNYYQLQISEH